MAKIALIGAGEVIFTQNIIKDILISAALRDSEIVLMDIDAALTRSFAAIGGPFNITVNSVAPGMIITENIGIRLTKEEIAGKLKNIPLRRAATMEETAEAIINTIKSGYITGETVNINGGLYYAP